MNQWFGDCCLHLLHHKEETIKLHHLEWILLLELSEKSFLNECIADNTGKKILSKSMIFLSLIIFYPCTHNDGY